MKTSAKTYEEAVHGLYRLQLFGVKLGLEKTRMILEHLGRPQDAFRGRACHIAGSNGKGTCAAAAEAVLRVHGLRCGLYTSPHLVDLAERIRVDGQKARRGFISRWCGEHLEYAARERVTFFETVTALAFDCFRSEGVRAAVVETGMGGRYDATGVVEPAVSVITSIGLEHTRYLGRTLHEVAGEKAGIARPGVPLICGERRKSALEVIAGACEQAGAGLLRLEEAVKCRLAPDSGGGSLFSYRGPGILLDRVYVPLAGGAALSRNMALGLLAAEIMLRREGIAPDPDRAREALGSLAPAGRFQRVTLPGGCEAVLDVAHNPAAAANLARTWERVYGEARCTVVLALAADKDFRGFVERLSRIAGGFVFPRVDFSSSDTRPAARGPEDLARAARKYAPAAEIQETGGMARALETAAGKDRPVLVTGSFRTVGAAMRELGIEP